LTAKYWAIFLGSKRSFVRVHFEDLCISVPGVDEALLQFIEFS